MAMNWTTRNTFFAAVILFQLFSAPRISAQNFTLTGSLNTAREGHTATLLYNGMVLIAGGADSSGNPLASAELYNPATGTFTPTGNLNTARSAHTATLLNNGLVLIAGGNNSGSALSSAELYNPATGTFTTTGSMITARWGHRATLLGSDSVLLTGGFPGGPGILFLSSAELYNPATGTFTAAGSMTTARGSHTQTLLVNGQLLIAGGYSTTLQGSDLASAELYDPVAGTFTATGSMITARGNHTATLLNNGQVLIAGGGLVGQAVYFASAELYDPTLGSFGSTGNMTTARVSPTATLLTNGQILVAGGSNGSGVVSTAEQYGPSSGNFTVFSDYGPGMTFSLSNSRNLCVSGPTTSNCGPLNVRWVASPFTPSDTFTLTQVDLALLYFTGTNGAIVELVNSVDGLPGTTVIESWTVNNLSSFFVSPGNLTLGSSSGVTLQGGTQYWLIAMPLADDTLDVWQFEPTGLLTGTVACAGPPNPGGNGCVSESGTTWQVSNGLGAFDVIGTSSPPFAATGSMSTARTSQTATLLNNGMVLIAGGGNATGTLSSAEIYQTALPPPTSQTIPPQPLNPTAPNQFQFDNNVHNLTVQYPAGTSFSGVDMTVTAVQTPQASFQERVAGTPFANAQCIGYDGEAGYCEDYQVSCTDTNLNPTPCPSEPTPTISVKTSYDTQQSIINPGFLTTPTGMNDWTNIFTAFYLQRIDPTTRGRTTGFSEFIAVDLGASSAQGAGAFQFLPPLQQNDVRIFPVGTHIPVEFQLTSIAQPGKPVTDATAGITVTMVNGNPTSSVVLESSSAFHYERGKYVYYLDTTGYAPGTYNVTVYGNVFAASQVQFTLPVSTTGAQLQTQIQSLTFDGSTNQYVATLTVTNTGTAEANGVVVFASALNFAFASTTMPVSLGDIGPASSATVTLTYPAWAGRAGDGAFLIVLEAFAGGDGDGFFLVQLP